MTSHSGDEQESVRLSEDAAAILLARASQLDAASANKVTIAELRHAARTAGIAPEAFEQALSEFRAASGSTVATPVESRRPRRFLMTGIVVAAAVLLVVALLSRVVISVPAA